MGAGGKTLGRVGHGGPRGAPFPLDSWKSPPCSCPSCAGVSPQSWCSGDPSWQVCPGLPQRSLFFFPRNVSVKKGSGQVALGTESRLDLLSDWKLVLSSAHKQHWEQSSLASLNWGSGAVPRCPHVPTSSDCCSPDWDTGQGHRPTCVCACVPGGLWRLGKPCLPCRLRPS